MLATDDCFYISLLSNGSTHIYKDNVLSAFTNHLKRPINLDGGRWEVGIVEVGLNTIAKTAKKRARREASESQAKKRNKRDASVPIRKIEVNIDETSYKIIITENNLQQISNTGFMNFTKFLENLPKYIIHKTTNEKIDESELKIVKETIFKVINEIAWEELEDVKYNRTNVEFAVTVLLPDSPKPIKNVVLKYKKHDSISAFLKDIILQFPKERRAKENLIPTFNIFHAKHDMTKDGNLEKKLTAGSILQIPFAENDASIKIFADEFKSKLSPKRQIELEPFLKYIAGKLNTKSNVSISEYLSLKDNIKESVIDFLRDNNFDQPPIEKTLGINDFYINLPISKSSDGTYQTHSVIVEAKAYNRMSEFLNELYLQIPKNQRNRHIFIESLQEIFIKIRQEQIPATDEIIYAHIDGRPATIVPPGLESLAAGNAQNVLFLSKIHEKAREDSEMLGSIFTFPGIPGIPAIPDVHMEKEDPIPDPIARAYENIYIYTDIIKPRFIGGMESRCLRVIPMMMKKNEMRIEFNNIQYYPLESLYLESVSILIANGVGDRVNFEKSLVPTYIQLHFKRIENYINRG